MLRKESIRESVLNAAGRKGGVSSLAPAQLIAYLSANDSRDTAYQCCVEAMEESQSGVSIGWFLLNHMPSFPPSKRMLKTIQGKCACFTRKNSVCRAVYKDVSLLCDSLLVPPFADLLRGFSPSQKNAKQYHHGSSYKGKKYYTAFFLQPPVNEQDPHFIVMENKPTDLSLAEPDAAARKRTTPVDATAMLSSSSVVCKDYIDQCPLVCSDDVILHQLSLLAHFWDHYRTNPTVINATTFLIKQMCDGYVAKLPYGPPYFFFRSVTICYLPTLFEWMENDYLCVQSHVYDFLLTLSTHLQLVDTEGVFPGCTEALQQEVIWLLLLVLERQATRRPYDEMIWMAAAKCALAVMPPGYRWLIDPRALMRFMQLTDLAELYPRAFTLFAEAFESCILHSNSAGAPLGSEGAAPTSPRDECGDGSPFGKPALDESLAFNPVELRKLGTNVIHDVLALYRRSTTVGARLAFFRVLFVWAVSRVASERSSGSADDFTELSVYKSYRVLVELEFFWHLHPLLFYEPQKVHYGLAEKVLKDVFLPESNDIAPLVKRIVQSMLDMIAEDAEFPRGIVAAFPSLGTAENTRAAASPSLPAEPNAAASPLPPRVPKQAPHHDQRLSTRDLIYDAMTAVPMMLREAPSEIKTYNVAWRLAFYCLRSCKRLELKADGHKMIEFLTEKLVSYNGAHDDRESAFIRRVCPDLLASLCLLTRTQADQAVDPFAALLEWFLFAPPVKQHTGRVMSLCHRFLESIAASQEVVKAVSADEDVASLLLRGALKISLHTARSVGARVFWGLYRALVNEKAAAACRTRFALICILDALMTEKESHPAVVCAWNSVTFDPCLRIASFAEKKMKLEGI